MKRMCIIFVEFIIIIFIIAKATSDFNERRHKRDDGSYMSDSGGPVAQTSKSEANGESDFGPTGEALDKLNPCEMAKSQRGKKGKKSKKGRKGKKFSRKDTKKMGRGALKRTKGALTKGASDGVHGQNEVKEEFEKFKKQHNKQYSNPAEEAASMKTFGENLTKMQKLMTSRRSEYDASFSMTKHSDMTLLDFLTKMSGALPDIDLVPQVLDIKQLMKKRNCEFVHWQKFGVIPDVHLQENCGCCYAHSAVDLIASQYQIDKQEWDKSIQLAPQYLADCMPEPKAYKCKGGRSADMLNYLATCQDCKVPLESCYRYKDKEEACQSEVSCDDAPKIKVKWAQSFDISGPFEKELMAALLQHGPVVAIVGVTEAWQMYNGSGILKFGQCTMKQMHAVLITGYNYTSCVPTYWVKNSWGDEWGGRGSIKLEAGKNTCSVAKTVIAICTSDDCPTNKADYLNYLFSKSNYPDCQD